MLGTVWGPAFCDWRVVAENLGDQLIALTKNLGGTKLLVDLVANFWVKIQALG